MTVVTGKLALMDNKKVLVSFRLFQFQFQCYYVFANFFDNPVSFQMLAKVVEKKKSIGYEKPFLWGFSGQQCYQGRRLKVD